VVLSIDEKTQIQALDRTQPLLPLDFGLTEQRTHDYKRHGTTNLFAALDVGTRQVTAACHPDRTGERFLAFLRQAVKPHASKEIHVVLDNLSTHTTPDITAWLQRHSNVTFHFTPVGSSWLNQIEIWFGIVTPAGHPTRHVHLGHGADRPHPRLRRTLERRRRNLHLDRHHRRDPRQGPLGPDQRQAARRQQLQVTQTESRNTRAPIPDTERQAVAGVNAVAHRRRGSTAAAHSSRLHRKSVLSPGYAAPWMGLRVTV